MKDLVKRLWKDEDGQAITEYGIILGLIAVAVIAVIALLGDKIVEIFTSITNKLSEETPETGN